MAPVPDNDHDWFNALFLQSEREILRYVLALVPDLAEAREIVQSTAIERWRKFPDYDATRPFTPWACRFALRQTQMHLRCGQRWRAMLDDALLETLAAERVQMSDEAERRFAHLDHCLSLLPPDQQEVIRLYHHEDLKRSDISRRLSRTMEGLYK